MIDIPTDWMAAAFGIMALAVIFITFLVAAGKKGRVWRPWDHEAALVRLCHGDQAMANRLIRYELKRSPGMSRAAAALSATTRLRHERQ